MIKIVGYSSDDLENVFMVKSIITKNTIKRSRPRTTKGKREFIYRRDKYKCCKCGESNSKLLTLDHIIPWVLGGSNKRENLQTLCRECNKNKGTVIMDYRKSKKTGLKTVVLNIDNYLEEKRNR